MHNRLRRQSLLVADGHLPRGGLDALWLSLRAGLPMGWALMSIMSAEVCYRALVLGQQDDEILQWMFDPS